MRKIRGGEEREREKEREASIYLEARRMIHDREAAFEYCSQRRLLYGGWVSITRIPAIDCALAQRSNVTEVHKASEGRFCTGGYPRSTMIQKRSHAV